VDVSRAVFMASEADFDAWLVAHGSGEREVLVAIDKQASGKQTVTLSALQEVALCHGWVDTQIQRIDEERYAIRFVPRRPSSNWSPTNREIARRLLPQGRIQPAGLATLPDDL
jgi:uncharacterized protein YdeI (YjbR/CyaY-like superfamily)